MQANDRTLGIVFDTSIRFMIPLFQRPYVWKREDNWEPLWEAVEAVADRRVAEQEPRPHFLGAIVLDSLDVPTGEVVAKHVIDGQQRLATLQIMLAAIRDLCKARGVVNYHGAFCRLTENYVASKKVPESVYKVWPTSQDRTHFVNVMTSGSPEALLQAYATHKAKRILHQVPQAYLFFYEVANEWIGKAIGDALDARLQSLHDAIRHDLLLVIVDLGDKDDAQLIFETMNALMTPLLPGDLIKNLLFHRAERQGLDVQTIYNRYWMTFDDGDALWREEVRQGRLKRPMLDLFIQHYLTLKKQAIVEIPRLYGDFKEYLNSREDASVEDEIKTLRDYADVYKGFRECLADSREHWFFRRLNQLDTQMPLPILLEVFKGPKSQDDRLQVIELIESYLVRRAVMGLTYKAYNRVFVDLVKKLSETSFSADEVRAFLLTREGDSSRWPDDAEFVEALTKLPLGSMFKGKRARLRIVLEAFERSLYDPRTERVEVPTGLTIEHIMPQSWLEHWPLPDGGGEDKDDLRNHMVQTIGNLTLLTQELNSTESNGPWTKKKPALIKYSKLLMNSRVQSEDTWDEKAIMKRGMLIAEMARQTWQKPQA